jgi:copper chaperone CopZ
MDFCFFSSNFLNPHTNHTFARYTKLNLGRREDEWNMEAGVKIKRLKIGRMTCISCQNKIERELRNMAGVANVKVSYSAGTAEFSYDTDIISLRDITTAIEKLDYEVLMGSEKQETNLYRVVGVLVIVVSLYVLLQQFGILNLLVPSQLADTKMGYGMLFVVTKRFLPLPLAPLRL